MANKVGPSLGALNSNQSTSQLVRTSTNSLYAVIIYSGAVRVYKSTDNGISWNQKDYQNAPFTSGTAVSAAIDGNNVIHIAFLRSVVWYIQFSTSTDIFSNPELTVTSTSTQLAIAVDNNNVPHIVRGTAQPALGYFNRSGGHWPYSQAATTVYVPAATPQALDIQIDSNNLPVISSIDTQLHISIGNKNNANSFTDTALETSTATFTKAGGSSVAIDASGNTWLAYQSAQNGPVNLYKHKQTDGWGTWQTAISDGFSGKNVSLAIDTNDIYIFYERVGGGLAYDRYNSITSTWLGEQIVQANTSVMTTNTLWHNPFIKWSNYFNNGLTGANNTGANTIEYLFDDGSTVYYDKLTTAQIATGRATISFSASSGGTTTSTSSSTSTSISSTSSSTSISTSSTSSSISTSSTSSSTSTSSTSSSTSISTSTSSTSSSTSTSHSTSTSSTSSSTSISTSSTSSSTSTSSTSSSTSISTSSTSSSTSTSQSTSTSSTSSSTSISTSSTSSSISTSSTSSSISISTSSTSSSISTSSTSSSTSTSKSTSTSSTSTSTTVSFTTSTSSTSSSISTSSTSSSTSTSHSTSSTSSSTSISTSSTSSSISTSSTSSSTSTSHSTSSTSSSTSTSQSTSTSSTSQSTSSSTSQSTSSTSTSTTFSFTTSTSSTSSSTSTSTTLIDIGFLPRGTIRPVNTWHDIDAPVKLPTITSPAVLVDDPNYLVDDPVALVGGPTTPEPTFYRPGILKRIIRRL